MDDRNPPDDVDDQTAPSSGADWSAPDGAVLDAAREALDGGERAVLATVVDVEGSAYRRPGAKMLVRPGAGGVGHVTAGCLEDEVGRLAEDVLSEGEPRLERYDLRPEGDGDVWGLGVGCNGVVDLLVEPLDERYRPVLAAHADRRPVAVATVLDGPDADLGPRAVFDRDDGAVAVDDDLPDGLLEPLRDPASDLAEAGGADVLTVDDRRVFVDGVAPPPNLVVVGTGRDVEPIVDLGAKAGFRVTVVGFRGADADPGRFPAAGTVLSTSPAKLREAVPLDADSYVVVATHNFVDDRIAVEQLLGAPVPYVGLLGPRERYGEMVEAAEQEGRPLPEDPDRLYTPVGLDLGAGSPYGVAVSVVSEVLAVANGREPGHLRARAGPVHDRVDASPDGE